MRAFFMARTELSLVGSGVQRFLFKKGIEGEIGNYFYLGEFTAGQVVETPLGVLQVNHSLVLATNNRQVDVFCPGLRRKGKRERRSISVRNDNGSGIQQVTKNVVLVVSTDADRTEFEERIRK